MKLSTLSAISMLTMIACGSVLAGSNPPVDLQPTRAEVIQNYVNDLQTANYKDITQLFEKDGYVVSNSRGKTDAKTFFYGFLPNVVSAKAEIKQQFSDTSDANSRAARFHYIYQMKDGSNGAGEYIDEFIFSPNSNKLAAVFMFENLGFDNSNTK